MRCRLLASAILLLMLGSPDTTRAEPRESSTEQGRVYDLARCLALSREHYPKLEEARAKLRQKQSQVTQARTAPYSQFSAAAGLTLAPTVRGTSIYSPNTDESLSSDMGLAWQVGVEGVVPLFTFGKIGALVDAAVAQVQVGEHELKREANLVTLAVRTAYYGAQLAREALALIDEAVARIDKHLRRLEQQVEEGEGDDIELLKMRLHRLDLDGRRADAAREEKRALSGLRFLTGVQGPLRLVDAPLLPVSARLSPLERYLEAALLFRPEVNMARAGVTAREAQWRLERARKFPDIGLGMSAKWVVARQVTDQRNPFVADGANLRSYGAGVVLRWNLDFLPQSARVDEAEARVMEVRATARFATGGMRVEVEQAYNETLAADAKLKALSGALQYSKQWLVKVQQAIDVGAMEDGEIVDPAKDYALRRYSYLQGVFDYNLAFAKLAQATGWDAVLKE